MSIATLILGPSGSGKTTSLRNLPAANTLLVQCIKKPLPFRSVGWKVRKDKADKGNIIQTDSSALIVKILEQSPHSIVVVDDYQAVLLHELLARTSEKTYEKFTDIAKDAWSVFQAAGAQGPERRVYILSHTQTDETGNIRMKTVGRMVDEKIVPEGYFTIVLRTELINGKYVFRTQTTGLDCCKSPLGMFDSEHIDNDLDAVDRQIQAFYSIDVAA